MSSQETPEAEKPEVIGIVVELPASPRGTYQRKRDNGAIVHGDTSGEWTLTGKTKSMTSSSSRHRYGFGEAARSDIGLTRPTDACVHLRFRPTSDHACRRSGTPPPSTFLVSRGLAPGRRF